MRGYMKGPAMTDTDDSNKQPIAPQPSEPPLDLKALEIDVRKKIEEGQIFVAYNLVMKGIEADPTNTKLREYAAIALLKTGAAEEAKEMISPILEDIEHLEDLETLHLMAQIHKESWRTTFEPDDLKQSHELYISHFRKTKNYDSGTNAMWTAWLVQNDELAQKLANEIIEITNKEKLQKGAKSLNATIALAQCYLLKKEEDLATAMLNRVQELASKEQPLVIVDLLSTFKFLHEKGFLIEKNIFDLLIPPTIVVFTGQMISHPDDEKPSFTAELEETVALHIRQKLQDIDASIGYSSAACGADILFIEEMIKRGGEVHIVLPYDKDDFMEQCISYAGPRWEARFKMVLEKANSVRFATEEKFLGHDMLHRFGNFMLHGLAEIRGDFLLSPPHLIAVWDASPESLPGGASDFIDHWPDIRTLHIIDLDDIRTEYQRIHKTEPLPAHLMTIRPKRVDYFSDFRTTPRIIKTMLFSDLHGFSKLKEEHIPGFLRFLQELKATLEKLAPPVESINTWGDGVFAVNSKASELAQYALQMSELIPEISANIRNLPLLEARISLHAGPVYEAMDPFRNTINFYGGHINRAARLEPVTVVGQVYATAQFMSLLTVEQSAERAERSQQGLPYVQRFTCEYVGVMELAKNFGVQSVYHLRWL